MRRARRIIVIIAGLLALLVLAVAILIATFDPNDFRDEIEARVAERIGRDLQLRGDISLSLFPWLAITTGDARLANPEGFGPEPFLALEGLRIGVRLLPLLAGRLEIGEIVLEAPRLQLVTDAEGRTNWQDLLAGDGGEGPTDVTAAGLVVENGEILIEDRAAGTSVRVSGLDLRVGRVALDEPVPITARMQIEQATDLAEVELEAEVTVALEPFELRVAEPRVDVALLSERLGTRAEALPIELRADEFSAADGHYLLIGLHLETALPLDSAPSGRLPLELRAGRIELDESLEQLAARALRVTAAGASLTADVLEGQSLVDDPLVRTAFALEP
ncbi:MAG TPA: AsmA family protein, partial [Steroidobacteraceae bacterium]|nr:AsmA family protein [Steroidobacteraceae bacterium]